MSILGKQSCCAQICQEYDQDDLQWNTNVAMIHSTLPDAHIFYGVDIGRDVKKQHSTAFLIGILEKKRELLVYDFLTALGILQDVWEKYPDKYNKSAGTYPNSRCLMFK